MKKFINGRIILPDGILQKGYLKMDKGKILSLGKMEKNPPDEAGETIIDLKGKYLSPGFIETHCHGGGGFDFMDGSKEAILGAARSHLRYGFTSIMPTTLTSSDEALFETMDAYKEAVGVTENMPHLLGLHLEGPYFNPIEKGAQPEEYILHPQPCHYKKILEYGEGHIKRWSLAPELPGALEMADFLLPRGVLVSAAHTAATYEEMLAAKEHGITHLTHFYCGMSTITRHLGHRILGVIEAGYLLDELHIEIIADGVHLPPALLKMILKIKDHEKITLTTDAMRGAGMPEGESLLGPIGRGVPCIIKNGVANLMDESSFAGSVATGDRLVRVMVYEAGLPLWKAVRMVTLQAAKLYGLDKQKGALLPGMDADLVVFDEDILIEEVYVDGRKCRFD